MLENKKEKFGWGIFLEKMPIKSNNVIYTHIPISYKVVNVYILSTGIFDMHTHKPYNSLLNNKLIKTELEANKILAEIYKNELLYMDIRHKQIASFIDVYPDLFV